MENNKSNYKNRIKKELFILLILTFIIIIAYVLFTIYHEKEIKMKVDYTINANRLIEIGPN